MSQYGDDVIKQTTTFNLEVKEEAEKMQKTLDLIKKENLINKGEVFIPENGAVSELVKLVNIPRVALDNNSIRNILSIDIRISEHM